MKTRKTIRRALPYCLLAAACLLTIAFFALYGSHNLNADDSSEMILAELLNEEGKFLSDSWLYSTELRIISPVPLYQLGLVLFSSWAAARVFAQAVVLLLIVAGVLFLARQMGLTKSAPYLATVFALPFSGAYAYIMLFGCYYALHLVLSFAALGLVCRFGRRGTKISLPLLVLLGFVCGLGGVRMLTMLIAPLFAAAAILALLECRRHKTFKDAAHEPCVRMAGASVAALIAAGLGYVVNSRGLSARYAFASYEDMQLGKFELGDFWHQFSGIVHDMGYRDNVPFFTMKGMGDWAALLICVMLLLAVIRLFARFGDLAPEHKLILLTAVIAIALGMALNVLLAQLLTRYFMVGTLLLIVLLFAALETEPCENGALRTLSMLFVLACFAFGANCTMRYDYRQGEVNYEMAASWLLERGYTQGYATFWNANTLTEASDGQIEMWVLADSKHGEKAGLWQSMTLQDTLQRKSRLTEDPEGKVFLLVDENEYKEGSPLLDEEHYVDMIAWSYYVYEYESAEEMRALLGEGAQGGEAAE